MGRNTKGRQIRRTTDQSSAALRLRAHQRRRQAQSSGNLWQYQLSEPPQCVCQLLRGPDSEPWMPATQLRLGIVDPGGRRMLPEPPTVQVNVEIPGADTNLVIDFNNLPFQRAGIHQVQLFLAGRFIPSIHLNVQSIGGQGGFPPERIRRPHTGWSVPAQLEEAGTWPAGWRLLPIVSRQLDQLNRFVFSRCGRCTDSRPSMTVPRGVALAYRFENRLAAKPRENSCILPINRPRPCEHAPRSRARRSAATPTRCKSFNVDAVFGNLYRFQDDRRPPARPFAVQSHDPKALASPAARRSSV